jgi:hypothetical protein
MNNFLKILLTTETICNLNVTNSLISSNILQQSCRLVALVSDSFQYLGYGVQPYGQVS